MRSLVLAFAAVLSFAKAAPAQEITTTGEFLLFCKSDAAGCEEEIDIIDFLLVMDETVTDYCAGSEGPDLAQTRTVMIEWLDAHPEIHGEPYEPITYDLVRSMFPCS